MRDLSRSRVLAGAKRLTPAVYQLADRLPGRERFALADQLRRASVSVPANIAEGLGRGTAGDLERHLRIASGSAAELAVLLDLARELYAVADPELDDGLDHVKRQLIRLTAQVHASRA